MPYMYSSVPRSARHPASHGTPRFRTASGLLTRYALSCGYIERYDVGQHNTMPDGTGELIYQKRLSLSAESGDSPYHVKGFVRHVHTWQVFTTLRAARQFARDADAIMFSSSLPQGVQ